MGDVATGAGLRSGEHRGGHCGGGGQDEGAWGVPVDDGGDLATVHAMSPFATSTGCERSVLSDAMGRARGGHLLRDGGQGEDSCGR